MENEKNDENAVQDKTEKASAPSIFSKEEIDTTVRQFLLDWIKGKVKLHFANAEHFVNQAKIEGRKLSFEDARKREEAAKLEFLTLVSIAAEKTPATHQEKEQAISEIFKWLLAFRCGNRLDGAFGKQEDYEARLNKIEEETSAMNESIQQLIIWYRSFLERK